MEVADKEESMTGREFERWMENKLSRCGYWVHRMAESNTGSQPFDIIALKGYSVFALDCKVISTKRPYFPFSRIEENQKRAFEKLYECYSGILLCAFIIYFEGDVYLLDYQIAKKLMGEGKKGITLTEELKIDRWGE